MIKFFERDGKYNWVDHRNVVVGFDAMQDCCENFGFRYYDYESGQEISGDHPDNLESFVFDVFNSEDRELFSDEVNEKNFTLLNPETGKRIVLTLYNSHNGYYAHGWCCELYGKQISAGYL